MPLLLSRLGGQEGGEIAKLLKQQADGLSLRAYLQRELADRVKVIKHSTKPVLIGAIPATETVDDDVDTLLERTTRIRSVQVTRRFHPAFWAAFRKPLDESKRRYISVQTPVYFQDGMPEDRPEGFVEIESQYIAASDAETAEVEQKARSWLVDKEIEEAPFLWRDKTEIENLPAKDLLSRLLLSLDVDDLRRISMPLDIVRKLRREPL